MTSKVKGTEGIEFPDATVQGTAAFNVPSGAVMDFAMVTAPAGWLVCDGAIASRTQFAALFAAIGTSWGAGDGSTTFNIPDFRGRFRRMAGTDGSSGMTAAALGAKQGDGFRTHAHGFQYANAGGAATTTISRGNAESTGVAIYSEFITAGVTAPETRPFNASVQTCIKV